MVVQKARIVTSCFSLHRDVVNLFLLQVSINTSRNGMFLLILNSVVKFSTEFYLGSVLVYLFYRGIV